MRAGDIHSPNIPDTEAVDIKSFEAIQELSGKLSQQLQEDKLMHAVLQNDKKSIEKGKLISDAINQGVSFSPDLLFEQMTKDYKLAKQIYGESFIRQVSGYDPNYIENNLSIPEFRKMLKEQIQRNVEGLKKAGLLKKDNSPTEEGIELATAALTIEELEKLLPRGDLGEKIYKKHSQYGQPEDHRAYKKGDRYKDIALKRSIKTAIRRKHDSLKVEDFSVHQRQSRGQAHIVYGLDASGSMKGKKLEHCKRAGIALAYKAILNKDKVGLLVFGADIKDEIPPGENLGEILRTITKARASRETDIENTILRAIALFPKGDFTRHFILITDALPTIGEKPEEQTIHAVAKAKQAGISISLIGIQLTDKGVELARKIAEIGGGRFYVTKNIEELDALVLEEYERI